MAPATEAAATLRDAWYIPRVADGVRTYSDEELEAILRRALEQQAEEGDGFGHDELVAAAREVGLDEGAVERAIDELSQQRTDAQVVEGLRRRRREKFVRHFVTFVAVVGGLLGMHALGFFGTWVFWVLFGWGIGIVLDAYEKLRTPNEEEVERERVRLNRHERRKARAEARREAKRRRAEQRRQRAQRGKRRSETSEQLEQVIEEGVSLLLGAAAKKIREATEQMDRGQPAPDTEFGRYVARKKGRPAGVSQSASRQRPQVRVETDLDDELEEAALEIERHRERKSRR